MLQNMVVLAHQILDGTGLCRSVWVKYVSTQSASAVWRLGRDASGLGRVVAQVGLLNLICKGECRGGLVG